LITLTAATHRAKNDEFAFMRNINQNHTFHYTWPYYGEAYEFVVVFIMLHFIRVGTW